MNTHILRVTFLLYLCLYATTVIAQLNIVTDNQNAQYEAGESMTFQVSSSMSGNATYLIRYDDNTSPLATGTININAGQTASIAYSHPEPGAVFCEVTQGGQTALATALFSPYEIQQLEPEPADFDAFWINQKNILASVPLSPVLNFQSSSAYATNYTIELGSIDNRKVYGYISIPNGTGPFPAILSFPSFGDSPNITNMPTDMAEKGGAISMSISIHNAPPNQVDPNAYEPNDISNREAIYMRYAILAGIRSIDYIFSRNDFDGTSMGVTGVSQGGALAIMLAGIDDRVKLLTYANPAWTEHAGLYYGKASGFPFYMKTSQNIFGSSTHEQATLSATRYYDVINFAKRYNGPSLGFIGYEDIISLPAGEFAAYNQLEGEKVLMHSINVGHNPTPFEYWNGRYDFFRRHFPAMLNPPFPWAAQTTGYGIDAGDDQNVAANTPITLTGSASLNNQSNALTPVKWEKLSGPGQVVFSSSNNYTTQATFSQEGTYQLRFTALDETNLSSQQKYYSLMDEVEITVGSGGNNNTFLSLDCPTNIVETLAVGQQSMSINWLSPALNSNCNSGLSLQQISGPFNGSFLGEGTYTVIYQANNSCGDTDNCNFNITINAAPIGNTGYCIPEATAPWNEWIGFVSFNTINNSSGKESYGDFTNQVTEVNTGQNYSLNVTSAYSWQQHASFVRVWIDYNRNNTFEDYEVVSSENIALQLGATTGLVSTNISIPSTAQEGTTRMRIALQRNEFFGPCGSFQFGEIEDYTILIGSGGNPTPTEISFVTCPNNITVQASAGANTAIANWNAPQAITNCPGSSVSLSQTAGSNSGTAFPIGTHTISYNAIDNCANNEECSFTITVNAAPVVGTSNCESSASFPWQEWIKAVSFGSINKTSGKEGYADFSNESTTVNRGESYPISVTAGFSWLQRDVYLRIWIDYNQDGIFNENTEVAYSGAFDHDNFLGANELTFQGNIDVPFSAQEGSTKMRISMQRDEYSTPCQQFDYGEVEDYTVIIGNSGGTGGGGTGGGNGVGGSDNATYCDAEGDKPWEEYISNVTFGGINNDSGKSQYGDFTAIQTSVEKGQTYFISLQPKFSYKHYDIYFRVWIDFNQDGDFYDFGETILSVISLKGIDGTLPSPVIYNNIEIPQSALSGTTRMRIAMQRGAYAEPCGTFPFGEVEDYSLFIGQTSNLEGNDHFLYLSASKQSGHTVLNWDCNKLDQTNFFLIERSIDKIDFTVIEQVDAPNNNMETASLKTLDKEVYGGRNYYRVKQVFKDGSLKYSPIRFLDFSAKLELNLFPNPVRNTLFVNMPSIRGEAVSIYMLNALGQEVQKHEIAAFPKEAWPLSMAGMQNGLYQLKMLLEDGRVITKPFVLEDGM